MSFRIKRKQSVSPISIPDKVPRNTPDNDAPITKECAVILEKIPSNQVVVQVEDEAEPEKSNN